MVQHDTESERRSRRRLSLFLALVASLIPSSVFFTTLTGQTKPPVRLGDRARGLSEQDVSNLQLALPQGQKPWILYGISCAVCLPAILAYLPPATESAEIRRGSIMVLRPPFGTTASWTVTETLAYAQVVVSGRAFDQIQSDDDINQPFTVRGDFDDDELLGIVRFARAYDSSAIRSVEKLDSGQVRLFTRRTATGSIILILGKQDGKWVIFGVLTGDA